MPQVDAADRDSRVVEDGDPDGGAEQESGPLFVLTPARSGSTLLRRILDAHPQVACPPEANLSTLFTAINFVVAATAGDDPESTVKQAIELSRELATRTIGAYAERAGKARWCDKSLPSALHADLLLQVFPNAQFVCLYRECTDTVASLSEACTWSYGAYGVEPYIRLYPSNTALALSLYWADRVDAIHAFEAAHPEQCHRVRYEDLVLEPEATLRSLFAFSDLDWEPGCLDPARVLAANRNYGLGDFKIAYTTSFEQKSIGRGWVVPVEEMPADVRERINGLLAELSYPNLEADARESLATRVRRDDRPQLTAAAGKTIHELLTETAPRLAAKSWVKASAGTDGVHTLKVVLADEREPYLIDLTDGKLERSERDASCTLLTDGETLLAIAAGTYNPGTALRQSRLRLAGAAQSPEALLEYFDQFVSALAA